MSHQAEMGCTGAVTVERRCLPDPAWAVRESFLEEVVFLSGPKGLARRRGVVGKRILGRGKDRPQAQGSGRAGHWLQQSVRQQWRGGGALGLRDKAVDFILRALGSHRKFSAGVAWPEWTKKGAQGLRGVTCMPSSLMAPPRGAARLQHHAPLRFSHPPFFATLLPGC